VVGYLLVSRQFVSSTLKKKWNINDEKWSKARTMIEWPSEFVTNL
jgi:hypothetical protein